MVKYRFDPNAPVITVYAEIEGEIIARSKRVLDTGATYTMIPWDIAEVLGYKPELSKDRVPLVTASGVERAPLTWIFTRIICVMQAIDSGQF